MEKKVFIINGSGGVGKDEFLKVLNQFVTVEHIYISTPAKQLAIIIGWNGSKTEKDRKFLSDLKELIDRYNDGNYTYVASTVAAFKSGFVFSKAKALFVDMREPKDIARGVADFGAQTVLVTNERVKPIDSNMADAGVFNYHYDYQIRNNGSLIDLQRLALKFAKENGWEIE